MLVEDRLRSGLRDAADAWAPSPRLADLVDERVRVHERRQHGVRRGALAGAATFVAVAAVVAGMALVGPDAERIGPATPRTGVPGWHRVAEAPIGARFQHAAVWTGAEVVVFGGYLPGGDEAGGGAAYDPAAGTWRRIAQPPGDVSSATVVVAGDRLLVLGTEGGLHAYDPSADEWDDLARSPFASTSNAVTLGAWTGTELVVVNGGSDVGGAAAYDPSTGRWRTLEAPPFLPAFAGAAWTGDRLVVAQGVGGGGASYPHLQLWALDPGGTGTWTELPAPALADVERRTDGFLVWTGRELVVGGGHAWTPAAADLAGRLVDEGREPTPAERRLLEGRDMSDAAAFDTGTGTWRRLPPAPVAVDGIDRYDEVWTGSEVLLWSTDGRPVALDPDAGTWRVLDPAPQGFQQDSPPAWTGHELVWWSGEPAASDVDPNGCCTAFPEGYALTP